MVHRTVQPFLTATAKRVHSISDGGAHPATTKATECAGRTRHQGQPRRVRASLRPTTRARAGPCKTCAWGFMLTARRHARSHGGSTAGGGRGRVCGAATPQKATSRTRAHNGTRGRAQQPPAFRREQQHAAHSRHDGGRPQLTTQQQPPLPPLRPPPSSSSSTSRLPPSRSDGFFHPGLDRRAANRVSFTSPT